MTAEWATVVVPPDRVLASIAFILIIGVSLSITNGATMALLQAKIPPEMQGRMFTIIGMVCTAMIPVGLSLAGPVADVVGVHRWYIISGVVIVVAAIAAALNPKIMSIENRSSDAPAEAGCAD